MFSRIDTVILRVRDIADAQRWYREKLGLAAVYASEEERLAVLGIGEGCSLTLWQGEGEPAAGGTFPILAVEDAAAAHAELLRRGVEADEVQEGVGVRYFGFRDPDGNRLEACQLL
jgi:catechol 2,3-dioxygenase-like lactoylglutathione lyase family enzyme